MKNKKELIKIEYRLDSDKITDREYEDQDELTFIVTEEMLIDLVHSRVYIPSDYRICENSFYVNKI